MTYNKSRFTTIELKNEFRNNVINAFFPKLNIIDKELLEKYYMRLIDVIAYIFNYYQNTNNKSEIFINQLRQNNYMDAISLMLLLLPYFDIEKANLLTSFNNLYVEKYDNNIDINKNEPKYIYSNIQYNRCKRTKGNITEIMFNEEYMKQNFYLLLESIRTVSYKLFVNWYNILPYENFMNNINNLDIVINTNKLLDNHIMKELHITKDIKLNDNEINDQEIIKYLSALSIEDIYNTITNNLYYDIKNIKWLIYTIIIDQKNTTFPIIIILKNIFGNIIDNALNNVEWDNIEYIEKEKFTNIFNDMIMIMINNNNNGYKVGEYIISLNEIEKILKSIIIFFDNYYKHIHDVDHYVRINQAEKNEEEEEKIYFIDNKKIIKSIQSIATMNNIMHIYEFIKENLNLFNITWYARHLFTYDIDGKLICHSIDDQYNTENITLKYVYNFAKSFCHTTVNKIYVEYPHYWNSLTMDERNEITNRLNNDDKKYILSWFNIRRNIQNNFKNKLSNDQILNINYDVFKNIKKNLVNYIVTIRYYNGTLSKLEFYPDVSVNNEKSIKSHVKNMISTYTNIDYPYYFLTSSPYKYQSSIKNINNQSTFINYLDYIQNSEREKPWFTQYALNWVAQLNFFHHYLNNRILFITGATGVGKSTQIPKLLLYSLKALNYNITGKIVCTEPRIDPTKSNAEIIANEMGVPLKLHHYIQYKYRGNDKTKQVNHLSLTFVTDAILNNLLTNPLFKQQIQIMNKEKHKIYSDHNLYDIIIIDEVHEHNVNMDLILSFMKYVANYNNSIKLVLISATMDEDEPIYRRFYRNINDNRMFPLNYSLKEENLDRINVDRRIHISIPIVGQSTQYKITDHYLDKDYNYDDPILNDIIIKIIMHDIIGKDLNGDILLFEPTVIKVNEMVKLLNTVTPSNTIALPYYRQLDKDHKNILENISNMKFLLKFDKKLPFNLLTIEQIQEGNNNYTRCIIVGTNIIEASKTVPSLRFVIESGRQNIVLYDYKRRIGLNKIGIISESSKKQRKGRVGRVASGDVYYLYSNKLKMGENIPAITSMDISNDIYKKLIENTNNDILFDYNNDPNRPYIQLTNSDLSLKYNNDLNVNNIIKSLYFISGVFYDYFGNNTQYDYENYSYYDPYYITGFDVNTIIDSKGNYYIIHPDELYIVRNIMGTITGIKNDTFLQDITYVSDNQIISNKMNSFINSYKYSFLTTNKNSIISKTSIGKQLLRIPELIAEVNTENVFNYDNVETPQQLICYFFGIIYNCDESIIRTIVLISVVTDIAKNLASTFIQNEKILSNIKNVINNINQQSSDIFGLLNIVDKFHRLFDRYNIDINLSKKLLFEQLADYYNENKINNLYDDSYFDQIIIEELKNRKLSEKSYNEIRKKGIVNKILLNSILNNKKLMNSINMLCNELFIQKEFILKYLIIYMNLKNKLYCLNSGILNDNDDIGNILSYITSSISKIVPKYNIITYNDRITISLLMGYSYNILCNFEGTYYYLSLYYPNISNIYTIKKIGSSNIFNTLVNPLYFSKYLLYFNVIVNEEKNTVTASIIHHIHPDLLKVIIDIYLDENILKLYNYVKPKNINTLNPIMLNMIYPKFKKQLEYVKNVILSYKK